MNDLRQAAQAALEFVEFCWRDVVLNDYAEERREQVEAALRAALAQPEPEPKQYPLPDDLYDSKDWRVADYAGRVEWLHGMYESKKREADSAFEMLALRTGWTPLYLHPPVVRLPLTDKQIVDLGVECGVIPEEYWSASHVEFARAILAKIDGGSR